MMKLIDKTILVFIFVLLVKLSLFADYTITRGPDIGEIYYIGPTVTGKGIYRSTDFGETAICMDSTLNTNIPFLSITADKTPGVLYGCSMPQNLYVSYDCGQQGSWIFRTAEGSYRIFSGRNEGEIFKGISMRSNNYGINFETNQCSGLFGFPIIPEMDDQNLIAYTVVSQYGIPDSLWLLITYNNYETLELLTSYNINEFNIRFLSRGVESGELFCITNEPQKLYYSNDNGYSWEIKNSFTCPNLPI